MSNLFLNFDADTGLSVNSFRKPNACEGDIGDLVIAYQDCDRCVCCELDGALDVLEDGSYWNGSDATQDGLEGVHAFITEFFDDQEFSEEWNAE